MNRFERSWLLFRSSLMVIVRNKELLVFPIVITACTLVILLFFCAPVALWPTGHPYTSGEHWRALGNTFFSNSSDASGAHHTTYSPVAAAYLVFLYFISMFVATFFNVAFYNEIIAALSGQPVSLSRGLKFACSRWKAILMWALFAGLIGLIIKTVERRFEMVGQIVARLIGLAWSIASVFVIPVIVRDEQTMNPIAMLRKSAGVLRQTWGESLIGYAGVSFGSAIIVLLSVLWLAGGIFIAASLQLYWLIAVVVASWLIGIVLWAYVLSVASQIFRCALFLYAAHGTLPAPYTDEMVALAWRMKKS